MGVAYNIMFKLIDRGVLEALGSVGLSINVFGTYMSFRSIFENGSLYSYLTIQLVIISLYIFFLI